MNIDLTGKTALVTGSTKGIGLASAKGLAESGARVVLNGRTQEAVDAAIADVLGAAPNAQVTGIAADIGTAQGCASIVAALPQCDILVNNAGIFGPQDFFETPDAVWQTFYDVNVMSGVRLSRAYLPGMIERNEGRILFSGAQRPLMAYKGGTAYSASKFAQVSLARSLAEMTRGTKVTVNTVMIGVTHSASLDEVATSIAAAKGRTQEEDEQDFIDLVSPASLLRRLARADEVANFMVYLASPLASATNGVILSAEGGTRQAIY